MKRLEGRALAFPTPTALLGRAAAAEWYERERYRLSGAGVWLLGGEPNTQPAPEFDVATLRVLVCRLSTYRDVAPSITHGLLAQIARSVDGVFVDFAYLPPPRDYPRMVAAGVAPWTGTT